MNNSINKEIKSFFNIDKDFPDNVFLFEEINLYCYDYDLLCIEETYFDNIINSLIKNSGAENFFSLFRGDNRSYENSFKINNQKDIQLSELYTLEEWNDMHALVNDMIYFSDESLKWGIVASLNTEWIILGITKEFDSVFQNTIVECDDFKTYKYANTKDAVRFSYPLGSSNAKFRKELLANYNFL